MTAVAAGCGATAFVRGQHHDAVRMLAGSPNAGLGQRCLRDPCTGQRLAREALFHTVQAQTAVDRAATLHRRSP